jgi:Na+-translocating ferredoxin:NAD+ oxidoreductase RnfC subunit
MLDLDRIGGMHLMDCRELRAAHHSVDRPAAILIDRGALVIAAVTNVQSGKIAIRDAAAPAQEAMGKHAEADRSIDLHALANWAHSTFFKMTSSSA